MTAFALPIDDEAEDKGDEDDAPPSSLVIDAPTEPREDGVEEETRPNEATEEEVGDQEERLDVLVEVQMSVN